MKTPSFKNWLVQLTKDERGSVSVKPVIAILGAFFLALTMVINSFTDKEVEPADNLVDAIVIITAIGMGADSLDKFSMKGSKTPKEETKEADPEV